MEVGEGRRRAAARSPLSHAGGGVGGDWVVSGNVEAPDQFAGDGRARGRWREAAVQLDKCTAGWNRVFILKKYILFFNYTVQLKYSPYTQTYPYKYISANPISMSTFGD